MKTSLKSLLLGTMLLSNFAIAGSETGGGGTYVLKDGEYVISDRYFESVGPIVLTEAKQYYFHQLPVELQTAYLTVSDFMLNLGIKAPNAYGPYLVMPQSLQNHGLCNRYVPNLTIRTDAQKRYGCTNGNITFLYMDILNQASLRQQAYAILHERLWTYKNANQKLVVDIVDGVMTLEEMSEKQKKGQLEPLSDGHRQKLEYLYAAARTIGLELTERVTYDLTEHGGRVKKGCLKDESHSYVIGIGSEVVCTLPKYTMNLSETVVLNSSVIDLETVKESWISNSKMRGTRYFPELRGNQIIRFGLDRDPSYIEGVKVESSVIYGNLITPKDSESKILVKDSVLRATSSIRIMEDVSIKSSHLVFHMHSDPLRILVGARARLDGLKMFTPKSLAYFPPESHLWERGYYANAHTINVLPETKINKFKFTFLLGESRLFSHSSNEFKFGSPDTLTSKYRVLAKDGEGNEFAYELDKRLKLID